MDTKKNVLRSTPVRMTMHKGESTNLYSYDRANGDNVRNL